jgi:hypothetical protein
LSDVEASTFSRHSAHRWRYGCQPYAPVTLYPQEYSWYSFLLQAKSTEGHSAAGRNRSTEKSNDIGNRTRDLPACSIVRQPTTLPRAPFMPQIEMITLNSATVPDYKGTPTFKSSALHLQFHPFTALLNIVITKLQAYISQAVRTHN